MRAIDAVLRGGANALANWQATALDLVESTVAATVMRAAVVPAASWLGVKAETIDLNTADTARIASMAAIFALLLPVIAVFMMISAFIAAGNARTYIDGFRSAAAADHKSPSAYRAFDWRRWRDAARDGFWRVTLLHAMTFGVMLVIVAALGAAFVFARPNPAASCFVMILVIPMFLGVVAAVLCVPKATIICIDRPASARQSLAAAWDELIDGLGTHVGAVLLVGLFCSPLGIAVSTDGSIIPQWMESMVREGAGNITTIWTAMAMIALTRLRAPA